MKKQPCGTCEAMRDIELMSGENYVTMKGTKVIFTEHFYRCLVCGEDIVTTKLFARNLAAAREKYKQLIEK